MTAIPSNVSCCAQGNMDTMLTLLNLCQVKDAQPEAGEFDNQKTLSDLFDEGDLAAGLQAWLRLTDNSITGMIGDDVCIADVDEDA